MARAKGRYKALEVKRECDYLEDVAKEELEAAAVKAAEESKRRAIATREAVEAAEAASARVV